MADHDKEMEKIIRRLESLELRLNNLESVMVLPDNVSLSQQKENIQDHDIINTEESSESEDKGIESQIGRFGLAWLGNIVFLFGIIFLTEYLMITGLRYISVFLGYLAAASVFFLAGYLKKTNDHLSFMFRINAGILLYYVSVRLHFFSASPVITSEALSIVILLFLIAFQAYLAIRNNSQAYGALFVIFALTTAILSDSTHFMLPLVSLTAVGSTYFFYKFGWRTLLVVSIFLTYSAFFIWLFGNPFMDHPMQILSEHHFGVIYLFILGACYSSLLLLRGKDSSIDDFLIGVTFINGILFTFMLLFVVLQFFLNGYVALFGAITFCCLTYSTVLHSRSEWNFASAFYALYGFMAMSVSLYGLLGFPQVYLLLSVQSLIVVSMALWFRNRLIVVMNSFLFLAILMIYLSTSDSISGVNFAFAFISLVSARIINWKRARLQIKTDMIRNLYMIEGFFMVLYALSHSLPNQFVTLSWTIAALLYFIISLLLKNIKYRYMALGTMICAAFYLFIVDLARIELVYRVLALLSLAVISIGISMYYTNRIKKPDN